MRIATRRALAGGVAAAGVLVGAVVVPRAGDAERAARERAERPVAAEPVRCAGRASAVGDPARDLSWSPAGAPAPLDQDAAVGDIRAATLRVAPRAVCLELRLRRAAPARLDVGLTIAQRIWSASFEVELRDGRVVEVASVPDGTDGLGRTVYRPVRASSVGDTIRVVLPRTRLEPDPIRLARPFRWTASTEEAAGRSWIEDTTRRVRMSAPRR